MIFIYISVIYTICFMGNCCRNSKGSQTFSWNHLIVGVILCLIPLFTCIKLSPFDNSHLPLWHLLQQLHMTLLFIPVAFQSSGQRQKESFFIPFCMPTYSLPLGPFVIRLLLLSAKLLVVFPSEAPNHHMLIFASERLKPLCPYWKRCIIGIVNFIWNV